MPPLINFCHFRAKYLFDRPYGVDKTIEKYRRAQQDAEVGIIFNTSSKGDGEKEPPSPINFELYFGFKDLSGKQYEVAGKFYKRNEIGIKTATLSASKRTGITHLNVKK